jgi:hypothetical protein
MYQIKIYFGSPRSAFAVRRESKNIRKNAPKFMAQLKGFKMINFPQTLVIVSAF